MDKVIKRNAISERITTIISKMNADVANHEGDRMWQNQIKKDAIDRLDTLRVNSASLQEMVDAGAWRRELESEISKVIGVKETLIKEAV